MSHTFGAATGDDVTVTGHLNWNSALTVLFGWWFPTTLTAGRMYWAASTLNNLKVHTTTSELALAIDRTTDSLWTTSGAAIVVNEWHFIVIAKSSNAGAANVRCWIGHGTNPPQEVTITETTVGSGTEVAASGACIGNALAAASVSFQGDIGQVLDLRTSSQIGALPTFIIENVGTITQAEADYFLQTVIIPHWKGNPAPGTIRGNNFAAYLFDLEAVNGQLHIYESGTVQRITPEALTINGATWSQNRQPMGIMTSWPTRLQQASRR